MDLCISLNVAKAEGLHAAVVLASIAETQMRQEGMASQSQDSYHESFIDGLWWAPVYAVAKDLPFIERSEVDRVIRDLVEKGQAEQRVVNERQFARVLPRPGSGDDEDLFA